MGLFDIAWEVIKWIWENKDKSFTLAAFTSLLLILIDKFGRKLITNQLKRLFHVQDKSEFAQYVANQARIESKLDALLQKEGVSWDAEKQPLLINGVKNSLKSSRVEKSSALIAAVFMRKESITISRGNHKLKTLLQKYSSTKLQALIVATIMNIALLVGYVMDIQDIQSKVDAWMPMANLIIQTVLTIAYQWARASVDKAEITAKTPEVSANDAKTLDSIRQDSEGA